MSKFFGKVKTKLDLNGPTLEFSTQPVSVSTNGVGIGSTSGPDVILSGIATVSFGSTGVAVNKGSIGYQWYESGVGKLVEGDKYVGTATTTLTIKNIITPTDNDKKYYLEADYVPGQPGARTGNALNEPLNSGIATVTVTPVIDINVQPSSAARIQNIDATFSVSAQLTNGATGGITYQWQIDEENITDGDISYNTGGDGSTKLLFLQSSTDPLASTVTPGTISYTGSALSASSDSPFAFSGSVTFTGNQSNNIKIQGPANGGGTDLQFGTGAFTVECWIKTTAQAGWIMNNCYNGNGISIAVSQDADTGSGYVGKLEFCEKVNGSINGHTFSANPVNDGQWHHIAMSRPANGSATSCYVDGVYQGNHGGTTDHNGTEDCFFGRNKGTTNTAFVGQISNFRITNTHLYGGNFTPSTTPLTETGGSSTSYNQTLVDGGSFVIPADATDVKLDLAAGPGGDGGNGLPPEDYGTGGDGGAGMTAWFSIPNAGGKTITFNKGYRGQDGVDGGDGGAGAAAGGGTGTNINFGASQGNHGGGGGGATAVYVDGTLAIILGGGGGGGAAGKTFQNPHDGQTGRNANQTGQGALRVPLFRENVVMQLFRGGAGEGTAGSGGGGGGWGETSGVNGGDEGFSRGLGGFGGINAFDPNLVSLIGSSTNPSFTNSDGWGEINYDSASADPPTSQNITVSGTQTPTLTIRSDSVLTRRIRCVVSHTSEDIPTVISNSVNFICQSTADTSNINIEIIGPSTGHSSQNFASLKEHNLNDGEYTFDMVPLSSTSTVLYYCFYSPDKDIDIEMDLYGGIGVNVTSINGTQNIGGQGGYSRIRFTLERNTEYIITGLNDIIDAPFVYRKSTLIACVGGGGDAGIAMDADGGAGGGIGADGADGEVWGGGGGKGGDEMNLNTSGVYGSLFTTTDTTSIYYVTPPYPLDSIAQGTDGGQAITCPKGVYYAQVGLSPCQDITDPTLTHFRYGDSSEVANSALINRGYKPGYDMIQTAGAGDINGGGNGGNGATGGQGGTSNCGGGGGSGYTDGSVTVLDTQQGGSSANSKVVIRLAL